MLETREKAEIRARPCACWRVACWLRAHTLLHVPRAEALSSFGFQYLSETYLPLKLQEARHAPRRFCALIGASYSLLPFRGTGSEHQVAPARCCPSANNQSNQ